MCLLYLCLLFLITFLGFSSSLLMAFMDVSLLCFRWCCLVFGSDHLLLFASLLVVFFFLAFNGVLDVDDIFLKCLEISDVSQRRSYIDDSILS